MRGERERRKGEERREEVSRGVLLLYIRCSCWTKFSEECLSSAHYINYTLLVRDVHSFVILRRSLQKHFAF